MNQIAKIEKYKRRQSLLESINSIIEQFCRERKLIIYGGIAIDRYLKSKGHPGIYDKYESIDYDTYSVNYLQDAEDLGKLLHESGIPYIKVHSGFKPTTRKIHISMLSTSVIDINEVSAEKYEILSPTKLKDGLLYIRPDALFEDQIKNLVTNLFIDYYRIPKIITRIRLLFEYFPIKYKEYTPEYTDLPEKYIEAKGIWAGDFAFNYYHKKKLGGAAILYTDDKDLLKTTDIPVYQMEGVTIYNPVTYNKTTIMIAPPALLLYFYFKMKIAEDTDKYDYQIWYLTEKSFPYPNYKEVYLYYPKPIEKEKYENIKSILLR